MDAYSKRVMQWCAGRALMADVRGDRRRGEFWRDMALSYYDDAQMLGGENFEALAAMRERDMTAAVSH